MWLLKFNGGANLCKNILPYKVNTNKQPFVFFSLLLFQFFIPSFQIILFCLCIGQAPYHLKMAVVNNETMGTANLSSQSFSSGVPKLGNVYLDYIDNHTIIQVNNYSSKSS